MANKKIKGITIEIGADTLGLDKALKGVEQSSKKASDELREVNKTIKTAGDSAVLWQQKQKLLTDALEGSREKLKLLEDAQEQVKKQLDSGAINGEQYRAFEREVEYARKEVSKYETGLEEANDKVRELGDESGNTAKDVQNLGDMAEDTANGGISAMTVALGELVADGIKLAGRELKDFTTDVVKTGMSYEASMSNVQALSKASSAEMEKLSAKAEEMGATTKYTAAESADAFGYMALAGWKVEDMLNGIDGVLNLAAASNMDLAKASDIVTDYLTAFGLTSSDSAHFIDMMTYAMANSNTTTEMLGEAYKNCAATSASLRYSAEETTAVLMTMANAGIKGGEAGTALNAIMTRLATDTKGCASALAEYGVDVYDTKGEMQSLSSILEGVSDVWGTLSDQQQANMAKTLAGTNHYAALQTIMNGLSDSAKESEMSFGDYAAALQNCDGAASDMSTTMMDNLQGDMTLLSSAVDGAKIRLAKELNPAMRDVVQYITKNVPNAEKAVSSIFKKGAEGTIFVIKHLPTAISLLKKATPIIVGVGTAFAAWKIAGTVDKAVKSISALNMVMLANPAVAVTAGVVGLTAAITALAIASKEAGDNELSIADEVAKKYEEEHQAVDDLRSSMNSMKDDFNKRAGDIESESKRTEDLWKELDSLTDSTGKVQDADKKRAEYILGELNEALGQEYTMTGNQIDRYKEMEAEIDTLIEKKKAAAMLDSFIEQDAEYTKAQKEALEAYEQAGVKSDQAKIDLSGYFSQLKRRGIVSGNDVMSAGWLQDQINTQGVFYSSDKKEDAEIKELIRNYLTALAEYEENQNIMSEQQSNYQTAIEYQQKLHDAEAAYAQGNYSDVSNILYSSDNDAALLKAETDLDKRNAIFAEMLKKSRKGIELALKSDSEYAVKDAIEGLEKTVEAGQVASVDIGKAFKANFGDEVQTMLDKGWDISDLSSWAKNSGLKTGDVFKDDYRTVVQKQIDRGFDIRELVIWGANSGETTGNNYDEKFEKSVQDALNEFYPDAEALMDWAREKGMAIGEILGEKIGEYCIPDIADKIGEFASVTTISSAWDAQLAAQGRYRTGVRFMADGGYLRSGQAVVAEAGPELLEIMNGGVKVTPLTGTSRNTPVQNSGAGQKIVSITNKIYANITSKYDVRRLAEDLAAEERILETAKGL